MATIFGIAQSIVKLLQAINYTRIRNKIKIVYSLFDNYEFQLDFIIYVNDCRQILFAYRPRRALTPPFLKEDGVIFLHPSLPQITRI